MMMRINELAEDGGRARLAIEGRLTAHTMPALEQACGEALANHAGLDLDVSQVQFADAAGLDLLRRFDGTRVRLVGCTGFLHEMLKSPSMTTVTRSTR